MIHGTCVGWKADKGFGFIRPDSGGADVFCHASSLINAKELAQGDRASFEIVDDVSKGKKRAVGVRKIL